MKVRVTELTKDSSSQKNAFLVAEVTGIEYPEKISLDFPETEWRIEREIDGVTFFYLPLDFPLTLEELSWQKGHLSSILASLWPEHEQKSFFLSL